MLEHNKEDTPFRFTFILEIKVCIRTETSLQWCTYNKQTKIDTEVDEV
jgi:hypothetical protein